MKILFSYFLFAFPIVIDLGPEQWIWVTPLWWGQLQCNTPRCGGNVGYWTRRFKLPSFSPIFWQQWMKGCLHVYWQATGRLLNILPHLFFNWENKITIVKIYSFKFSYQGKGERQRQKQKKTERWGWRESWWGWGFQGSCGESGRPQGPALGNLHSRNCTDPPLSLEHCPC